MEKESLYILKLDTQGSKVKFPNADIPAKLGEYTYTAQRMAGTPTLTATLNYPSCLDELWTGEEFVEFRGEKYYIDQVPTSSKDNKSIMYKHELQFVSERIVLENVYFMDVVTAGEDTYHSNSTSVKFMGDINEFVGRLNASMTKSGIGYSVVIDEDITSESKLVSLDSVYLAEALQSIYTIYELPYYFVGKVCHIGYTENVISTPFEYKKGLVSIKKTNANYKIVNRVTGVGSSDNIPFYYPNDDEKGTIERTQNLMPSIYRQTNGAERFYNALNDTYKIPGTNDYYFFKNTYSSKKVKEIKVDFSDIKPTIENVTNASGQLFGEIADIAFDDNDSDELGTGEGNNIFNGTDEYVHSYFYIKLHIYNGDYGFNLFEQGLEGGTAVINMTTGNCAACEFEIGVTYKDNEPGRAFNPVLVDSSGNLPAGDFEQKVTSQTSQYVESQQNTSTNEVWIAVKKDNTTFGVVMPNATNNYKPSVGDKFVITGIKMPKSLVLAAEKRLDEALIKYMSENNDEKFSFSVSFSRVFLAENSMLAGLLNENSRIYIKYNDKEYFMYVNSFTCKADKNCLYDISVELTDKLSANVSALRSTITEIAGDIIGERMGASLNVSDILGRISRYFISKINSDTSNGLITFLKGIIVKSYLKIGEFITGVSGGYIDEKGNLEMESGVFRKRLFVPEIAYNRTTYFKGRMVNSPGGGCTVLSYVDNGDGTYTITPDLTDADGLSQFVDDILTTYFVTKNSEGKLNGFEEMKFRVTAADYTAKKFTVIPRPGHSDWKPAEQMVLAQTGNFTDPERQTYILIDSVNGNNCITFFDNANTWDPEPAQMPAWFGKKKGMTVNGIDCEKYSAVLQQVLLTGLIFQIDEITGNKVRVPLDKGEWVAGKYAYYDRVSHNGALWLCVDDNGTTTEPSEGNPAWLKQVAEGADGATGPQGVPGTPGKDGVTYYTWIRYADNAQGGGISNNPTGKAYIGFAYNKTSAVESNTPSDYTWSEIKGEQGVPGAPGADGKTYYTWIAYSDNADGTGMYQQPNDNTKYIGIAVNKETVTESSNPSDYTWSLFKGKDGADGLSVIGGGHWESSKTPYKANTMVTLANCVFISKVETSNPPIRILRIKGGNFLRKKDGGYYLAGKPADWEVNEDWDMLLDGRELKGESITFLGEFATAPANPKNGDSYRNTTDRATYIYQDGRWQLMISDGKDGKGYEYIYTRGNIIDNTPEKPDSQQKDGYVPEGWTDNYLGTDADHQVEWGCTRFKENGVWSEFSDPAVVHRWSKDGENAIMADFDNEMVNAALTSDGKVVSSQTWNTTVSMWYGTEKLTLDSITCTPDTNLLCATDKNTGVVTISVSAGATLAATNTVKITIRATKNGQQYSRDLSFTVAGVRGGADGSDAVLYSIIVSATSVSKDKNGNYSVSSVSCYRQKSVGGVISTTTDGTLKYSIDGGTETTINNNTAISSGNFTKTLKFVFYVNDQIVDIETVPMLSDGKDGADGLSVIGGGHWESSKTPYKANTMVTLANCVFISKVETSNPPIRILRIKGGNFLRKKDGGYYLAGKPADWEVNEDWDMLLDGRELKGESITFLGEFATAPANPKNGDSYRNTTDRATYIYQDGRWQLMISDGKDGKGYEYIYTRGNIIDNTPEKPDSQQKDGYVPEGWTDNYLGTDADHQVEWGCTRFKENGVWSEFSDPAVVHRWSKDGENAIMADFDNEMVNAALTSDGKVVSSQTWNTTVSMWYGTEKLTLDSITCTPDTNLLCATDKNTGVVTISVSAGATLAATNTVKITIRATKNGQQYSRDLSFTVAGVRGGADGSDAVLYSIIVSATSVSKDKNGNYSVSSVSCYRQKSVGGVISTTTDGTLKYSIDGGTETTINNNTAISSGNFTKTLKFVFYVNDQIVDIETVPMLSDGKDGADGESITAAGHWESANTPYAKNSTVSFAGGSYLSKVQTSNPPLPLLRVRGGRYLRKKDGGYILSGKRSDKAVNSDWQEMTSGVEPSASYWLDSPVSTINFTSTGTPSPSAFVVTMKQNVGGNVSDTNRFYLAARKYNGSWLAHVGATLSNQISVPATAGYTQFAVRAYQSASDANAWNNNFIAEKGVGVANDGSIGATGATGAFPRDRGVFTSGQTYVWNADYRDKVIYLIGGVYYNFLVKNYGASVTAAPTSANGDSNWEAMQKFVNIATDTLFADGANVAGFMFKNNVLKSHNDEGETLLINGVTGYFKCKNAEITGTITADKGRIGPFSIASGVLSSKILYEKETNKYVGFNLSAGQIEFYNERTFARVKIGGNTAFGTIEGIKYDAGIDIQSPNAMIGMHIKTLSIPLFVEGGNIFLHPNNDSYVSLRGIVGNWRNISVKASLNNNDDNVMFINRDNIEVTLPPDVPGHTIYFKRMSGGVRLTGGRILPAPGGQEVSYIDLDFASGFIKCMGNYWVMFYCG